MGSVLVSGTDEVPAGNYIGFLCLTDVTIGAFKGHIQDAFGNPVSDFTGTTFPAGVYVPVPFSYAALASGTLIAIKSGGLQ